MAAIDLTTERADPNLILERMYSIADESNTFSARVRAQIAGHLELAARMTKYGHVPPKFSKASPDGMRRVGYGKYSTNKNSVGQAVVSITGVPADTGTVTITDAAATSRTYEFDTNSTATGVAVDISAASTQQDVVDAFVAAVNADALAGNINVYAVDMGDAADGTSDGTVAILAIAGGADTDLAIAEAATNLTVTDFQFDTTAS